MARRGDRAEALRWLVRRSGCAIVLFCLGVPLAPARADLVGDIRRCDSGEAPSSVIEACSALLSQRQFQDHEKAQILARRARAYQLSGELELAMADYQQAISLRADFPEALNGRGVVLVAMRRFEEAIADFTDTIRLMPEFAGAYNNRGNARQGLGDMEGALADYDAALNLRRDMVRAYNNRGVVQMELGRLRAAIRDFGEAVSRAPQYSEAYNNMGVAFMRGGQPGPAAHSFSQAIRFRPGFVEAYTNRGEAYIALNDVAAALSDLDTALSLEPDGREALLLRGTARRIVGDHDAALADCERAIVLKPSGHRGYFCRGMVAFEQERFADALADFRRAVTLRPEEPANVLFTYLAALRDGRTDAAQRLEARAADLPGGHPYLDLIAFHLGRLSTDQLLAEARRDDDTAGDKIRQCDAYFNIGERLLAAGQAGQAREMFARAAATGEASCRGFSVSHAELERLRVAR
jgi:tetratricopeptide (TPR) repeat protein